MEASHPLSIESFSYSWLVNLKPSLDLSLDNSFRSSLDASDEASFIEMDPTMTASKRFFRNSQDFKFDFPISHESPLALVHADELFSDGYLMPLFVDTLKMEAYYEATSDHSTSALPSAYSLHAPKLLVPAAENNPYCSSLRRSCRRMAKHIFQKYLDFLRPFLRRLGGNKSRSSKAEVVGKRVKNWAYWSRTSPRISVAYPSDHRRRSCDSESSIYEAVLHCKRSIGK
ncbi:probable membrane-associated kinase regulator 6 [Juglans regia]|uniref:Probable membrane-associated kinase regulator 6 n=2 Tax=Juglans regia TaxID=51240 RepID=A0A6P9EJ15_JUGRE|nr:probable membrane-associated kinase regulator 6 [Juglans regia]